MANITKVPNGPLIKRKGPYAGSTLKTGGRIKKAANGTTTAQTTTPPTTTPSPVKKVNTIEARKEARKKLDSITAVKRAEIVRKKDSISQRGADAKGMTLEQYRAWSDKNNKKPDATNCNLSGQNSGPDGCKAIGKAARARNKNGGMIKRADGSISRRGLWDNLRANKGSGKKPTKQMLVQEKKIKSKK